MCGFAGFWPTSAAADEEERRLCVRRMADRLAHRGPDDSGIWTGGGEGPALGFRRLAILDLSPDGHQPMISESGRYVITFNGEVYNFRELRSELERAGHGFRGGSDTEVLLAAVEEWGWEAAVGRLVGMFAFALWDRQERRLALVRDRLGIKPLYYGWMGGTFLFGSELKALRAHPDFEEEIDRGALALFMRHNYVPAPHSIYKNIYKLPPGHSLTLASPAERRSPVCYWAAQEYSEQGALSPFTGSEEEAVGQVDTLLREAVRLRMIADVPLGAFLSGGIDSSTVVALMQAQSAQPVRTFTIGFREDGFDEAGHARAVAKHLGTDHTELYVTPPEAQRVIPLLPEIYDEPFSDSSQIPTLLLSQLTRKHVTVSLSGDGGDELFGGYSRYAFAEKIWRRIGWMPPGLRRSLGRAVSAAMPEQAGSTQGARAFGEILACQGREALYRRLMSHWKAPGKVVIDGQEPATASQDRARFANGSDFTRQMMDLDLVTYLPDDILTKVDRASMAVSLEARVPMIDHRVVEFAFRLPRAMRVREGETKRVLRQVLYRYVPREIVERPKMGFSVPVGSWLRGPLRDWAEELLKERRLREEGWFHPEPIRAKWRDHLAGRPNCEHYLWDVLMFQSWLEHSHASRAAGALEVAA